MVQQEIYRVILKSLHRASPKSIPRVTLLLFDSRAADVIAQDGLTELGRADGRMGTLFLVQCNELIPE